MPYAWIIDKDHLAADNATSAVGVIGPGSAPDNLLEVLKATDRAESARGVFRFRMYDDDGNLYYTGRLVTDEGATEEACYAPLGDWGGPAAGAVEIRYPGHKDMDCG